jgi:carbamate kinase
MRLALGVHGADRLRRPREGRIVAADDPAFRTPTKPIGPVYSEHEARGLAGTRGWTVARDGSYFRRVVASPDPKSIVELDSIERLVMSGAVVVCAGGGGIPVARNGGLRGVEAVVDKDLTAALLAEELGAERLVLATDVPFVERDWRTASASPIKGTTPSELRRLTFAAGSMAPKIEAACRFVERTDCDAAIGALGDLRALVRGTSGTQIHPDRAALAAAQ